MNDFELEYVSFDQAKLVRALGYPKFGSCNEYYDENGRTVDKMCDMTMLVFPKPELERVAKWLRKKQHIHIRIECDGEENYIPMLEFTNSSRDVHIENKSYKGIIGRKGFSSYDLAMSAGIDKAIEEIIELNDR